VLALALPSRYSSPTSLSDAKLLAANLGIELQEVSIEKMFQSSLETIAPYFQIPLSITEENLQARIRGTLLMAFSNQQGSLLLTTGNKSELALGYATLYGDMCGAIAAIGDLVKGAVYELAHWINQTKGLIPQAIIDKEPSAELRHNQRDSDSLPPYPLLDSVVTSYIEKGMKAEEIAKVYNYPEEEIRRLIRLIHRNEYKRRQGALVFRVTEKAFIAGRRFPIVQGWI
jgi:NAD+ synthase (glutamine-hydrolysing)